VGLRVGFVLGLPSLLLLLRLRAEMQMVKDGQDGLRMVVG
jgi:hypothetical protein